MPFSKKKPGKRDAVFQIHLHSLEPWPEQTGLVPLAVSWERASSHKGVTDACSSSRSCRGAVYEFEETLRVPCTLVQEPSGAYAKKWLVMQVVEAGPKKKASFGRIVIDLGEFASLEGGQSQHSFEMQLTPAMEAMCHDGVKPRMLISIGMQGKDSQAPMYFARGSLPEVSDTSSTTSAAATNYDTAVSTQHAYNGSSLACSAGAAASRPATNCDKSVQTGAPPQRVQPKAAPGKTSLRRMSQAQPARPVVGGGGGKAGAPPALDYLSQLRAAETAPKGNGRPDKIRDGARQNSGGPGTPPQEEAQQAQVRRGSGTSRWSDGSDGFSLYSDILAAPQPPPESAAAAAERVMERRNSRRISQGDQPEPLPAAAATSSKSRSNSMASSIGGRSSPALPSVRHPSHQSAASTVEDEDTFEEEGDTFQVPDDRFGSKFSLPTKEPPKKRTTKILSIGNLADVDATLLAVRGPSVRSNSRRVMRETSGAVTNSRKWMRRLNQGEGGASRVTDSRRAADLHAAQDAYKEQQEAEKEEEEEEEAEEPAPLPPPRRQQRQQDIVPPAIIEEPEEEAEEAAEEPSDDDVIDPRALVAKFRGQAQKDAAEESSDDDVIDPKALVARFRGQAQKDAAAAAPVGRRPPPVQQPQHSEADKEAAIDRMAARAAQRPAAGLHGRGQERPRGDRTSRLSDASTKSEEGPVRPKPLPRARRASSLFSERPKSMRAMAAAALKEAEESSDDDPPAPQQRKKAAAKIKGGSGDNSGGKAPVAAAVSAQNADQSQALLKELRTVAALEAAVYLARSGRGGGKVPPRPRQMHAPARRLARTTISLGPEEGIMFGLRSIRAIEAAVDGCGEDVPGLAHWWSNCLHLRWMLWAMCRGDDDAGPDEFDWVMQVLVPPLREMEAYVFDQMARFLWRLLIEGLDDEPKAQPLALNLAPFEVGDRRTLRRNSFGDGTFNRKPPKFAPEELATQRWLDSLASVHRVLVTAQRAQRAQHVNLLLHRVLTTVLHKLDAALFSRMVGGEDKPAFAFQRQRPQSFDQEPELHIKSEYMPFRPGPLTCGTGVQLKMAITRWSNWATDVGLRDLTGSGRFTLFPRLRASCDLLMMPKEVLADRAIRAEVVPTLSVGRIVALLARFQPDDYAPDPLPHGLMEYLSNETPPSAEPDNSAADRYEPPGEAVLLSRGLIEPVSLEMDEDSDEELEAMAGMYDQEGAPAGDVTHRYNLLRELWSSAR